MNDIKDFYTHHLKKYGKDDIRAMGWHDEEEYSIRFEIATHIADLNNSSILDVGCGFGGLYKFMIANKIKCDYLGIDIHEKMIELAKEKNPTAKFELKDILKGDVGKFDYVFAIGTLNLTTDNCNLYFRDMLKKMIDIAKKGVSICFLSDKNHLCKGPYHFEDPALLKKEIEAEFDLKTKVVNDDRLKGESCLFVFKD